MPGNFRTGSAFPGTGALTDTGTDTYNTRADNVDVVTAEVVNSLANSVVKAQRNIITNQPMTTLGDLIIGGIAGSPVRLGAGLSGQVLTISAGVPVWQTFSALTDPMTSIGDLIIRNSSNVTARLPVGVDGQVLTAVAGVPAWATPTSGFADPMTTIGDLIYRNGSNLTSRIGIGSSGQVLTVSGGLPTWVTSTALTDPMTTVGDLVYRDGSNLTARLPAGLETNVLTIVSGIPTWYTLPPTLTDPMTDVGDMIYRNALNQTDNLPIGTEGQILTVDGYSQPKWLAGFSNPLTASGDILYRNDSNIDDAIPIGTLNQVLTVDGYGLPSWQAAPTPIGALMPFAGTAAPAQFLLCSGQAVSRTIYANLFAVVSTLYGIGDGSTTFNLPDLRGRVAIGKDDMGGIAANRITSAGSGIVGTTLAAVGGAENVTLSIAQLPSHTHAIDHDHSSFTSGTESAHTHGAGTFATSLGISGSAPSLTGTTSFSCPGHTHGLSNNAGAAVGFIGNTGAGFTDMYLNATGPIVTHQFIASNSSGTNASGTVSRNSAGLVGDTDGPSTGGTVGITGGIYSLTGTNAVTGTSAAGASHSHNVDVPAFTGSSGTAGTGTFHNNVQPGIVLNYIIRY